MKLFRYIVAFACMLVTVSCVTPFDLKLEDEPVICLNAFPGVEDMVVFSIVPAYSLSNGAKRPEFNPEIVFTVNSETVPVVRNTGHCVSEAYPEDAYVADYKPVPGDRMTVEVTAEGFPSVSADTSIPQPFPERKIDYRQVDVGEKEYYVVYVTFEDDADTDYSYGISVLNENIAFWPDEEPEILRYVYAGGQISDNYVMAPESLDGMRISFNGWGITSAGRIASWDGGPFNGKEKTLSMTVVPDSWTGGYESFFEQRKTAYRYDENGEVVQECEALEHNKLMLYSMSEEFYKYVVAQELVSDNTELFAGIAPSNFCYSNVNGGYGAFAGVCCVETDWITQEFIESDR